MPVVRDDGGCVGGDVGREVFILMNEGVPVVLVPSASPILSTSLWEGPSPVDRCGWLQHRVPGSDPTTLTPRTVHRFSDNDAHRT